MGLFAGLRQRRSKRCDRAPIKPKAEKNNGNQSYAPPDGPPPLRPTTFPCALLATDFEHTALNSFLACSIRFAALFLLTVQAHP